MKKLFLPFLLLVVVFSFTSVSIYYLPFLQFAPYHKSDSGLVDSASFLSDRARVQSRRSDSDLTTAVSVKTKRVQGDKSPDPGRIRSSQNDKSLTIISVDSESVSANTGPYEPPLIISNSELCKNSPNLDWVVYVYSSVKDFDGRLLLRKTWFNTQLFQHIAFKVAFFMGRDSDDVQQKVEEEHYKYHDIVQGDFVDSYNNLTLKAVMALKWISTYCPNAPYAMKADDDTFVNIFEIAWLLKGNRHKSSVILCWVHLKDRMPILRDPKTCSKYCVKDNEFPGLNFYPQYCSGPFYIISSKLIKPLYEASKSTPYFFIEDVYVTGMLTQKIPDKIDYVNLAKQMTTTTKKALDSYKDIKQPIVYNIVHAWDRKDRVALWNALLDRLSDSHKELLQHDVSYYRVD